MKTIFSIYLYYLKLVGKKFHLLLFLTFIGIALEGFGVGIMLPLMQGIDSDDQISKVFRGFCNFLGVSYELRNLLILLVVIITIRSVFLILQSALGSFITAQLQISLRRDFIDKVYRVNYEDYLKYSSGGLSNLIVREINDVASGFNQLVKMSVQVVMVMVYCTIPFLVKPDLVLILFVAFFPLLLVIKKIMKIAKNLSLTITAQYTQLQKLMIQALSNYKYLKATNQHEHILSHVDKENEGSGKTQYKQGLLSAFTVNGFDPLITAAIAGAIYYFVQVKGENPVELFFILFLLLRAAKSLTGLQTLLAAVLAKWGSLNIVEKEVKNLSESQEEMCANPVALPHELNVQIKNLSFSYNSSDQEILQNLSIEIPINTTVAFVGESGSGKSTLVNLIIGLLKPTDGALTIGGESYNTINLQDLRKRIGYITQENVIFNDSVLNNITLWNYEDKEKALGKAEYVAQKAHILDYIKNLDSGFDTELGENGVNISGGQRQRISIARELFKDTDILVFDEATSALDSTTEKEIQKNIDELRGEKTILLIAHRLSTVKNADIIYVMSKGKVVESGSYSELLQLNGEFKQMVDLQS